MRMESSILTKHAVERFAQRGYSPDDVDLIMKIGTEVDEGFLVREKDVEAEIELLRKRLKRVERLKGARLVIANGAVITGYRTNKRTQKRLLKSCRA